MNKYYALWGQNGVGVYNSWDKVVFSRQFLSAVNCKKCSDFTEACTEALSGYNECAGDDFAGPLPLNFTLYKDSILGIRGSFKPTDSICVKCEGDTINFVLKK